MRRDLAGLAAAGALTIAAAMMLLLSGLLGGGTAAAVLRVVAGVPLVLVLPGYALSAVALPDRVRPAYINAAVWHGMWIAGLSLATAVLGGLLLNLTPAGLTRAGWTVTLAGTTLVALIAAAIVRTRRLPAAAPAGPDAAVGPDTAAGPTAAAGLEAAAGRQRPHRAPAWSLRPRLPIQAPATVYSIAAVVLAGAAIWLGAFSAAGQHRAGFAQLWLVPTGNGTGRATVGVRNEYSRAEDFRLVLRRGSRIVAAWDLELAAGNTWTAGVAAPASQRLSAQLAIPGERTSTQVVTLHQGAGGPAATAGARTRSHHSGRRR